MTHRSSEEVLAELVEVLGSEFGTALFFLQNSVLELMDVNRTWRYLFVENEDRHKIAWSAAPNFFSQLSRQYHQSLLIGISRLLDKHKTRTGVNLSLYTLCEFLESPTKDKYLEILKSAEEKGSFAKTWRNKRLAHSDWSTSINEVSIEPSTPRKITESLQVAYSAIRLIHLDLRGVTMADFFIDREPAEALMQYIYRGMIQREAEQKAREEAISDWKRVEDVSTKFPDFIWSKSDL